MIMCRMITVTLFVASLMSISSIGVCQVEPAFVLRAMGVAAIKVSTGRITNLVFPGAIRTGIKVSNDIMVQRVKGVDNVIELKAMRKGFSPTSVSVFSGAGQMYSFLVEYCDSAKAYDFSIVDTIGGNRTPVQAGQLMFSGMPCTAESLGSDADSLSKCGFLHRKEGYEGMRLRLRGIYLMDSLLWFTFDLRNHSLVPYKIDYLRVYSTEKRKIKRTASHEADVEPKYLQPLPVVAGQGEGQFCVGFEPFTLAKSENLCVELGEANGGRTIKMTLDSKILLKARK